MGRVPTLPHQRGAPRRRPSCFRPRQAPVPCEYQVAYRACAPARPSESFDPLTYCTLAHTHPAGDFADGELTPLIQMLHTRPINHGLSLLIDDRPQTRSSVLGVPPAPSSRWPAPT